MRHARHAAVLAASACALLLFLGIAGSASGTRQQAADWSGAWDTNTGFVQLRSAADAYGRKNIVLNGGQPCRAPTEYYVGVYGPRSLNSNGDEGHVIGCSVGSDRLLARWASFNTTSRGTFDIRQTGDAFSGRYTIDGGRSGPYTGKRRTPAGSEPKCRKLSVLQPSADEPKCEYTVRYHFDIEDTIGRRASAAGKLFGTRLNGLDAVKIKGNANANVISWEDRDLKITLRVSAGTYRKRTDGPRSLYLTATVATSNYARCPPGKTMVVFLQQSQGSAPDKFDANACPLSFPNPGLIERSNVDIDIDVGTP